MRRRRAILLTTASLAVIGSVWFGPELLGATMTPEIVTISTGTVTDRSEELARCRLSGAIEALDAFVAAQQTRVQERASDPAEYRVLAEAHLERCLMRDTRRGMAVGKPTHTELPEPHREHSCNAA